RLEHVTLLGLAEERAPRELDEAGHLHERRLRAQRDALRRLERALQRAAVDRRETQTQVELGREALLQRERLHLPTRVQWIVQQRALDAAVHVVDGLAVTHGVD